MVIYEIEKKRKILIEAARQYGLSSPITLKRSQELDALLFQQQKETHSSLQNRDIKLPILNR
ncbi:aspartyl-phosphate phosphatase Spo0E family protein [Metabacillus arenae]|uniref:Aspartyl-phosphate phosphatase Spo0E family protein n=1 Tax=Metabacillus arenae TaxID=2771434 RepID=A0A926S131_9BACI|nr:aspartyl-phosphate phosphatase Spo0E family protein [Metabacillus arenae]MBD1380614.1 aspartyl-phosphate phosphatase Spo0E family protein [Metabacillus arenae]